MFRLIFFFSDVLNGVLLNPKFFYDSWKISSYTPSGDIIKIFEFLVFTFSDKISFVNRSSLSSIDNKNFFLCLLLLPQVTPLLPQRYLFCLSNISWLCQRISLSKRWQSLLWIKTTNLNHPLLPCCWCGWKDSKFWPKLIWLIFDSQK